MRIVEVHLLLQWIGKKLIDRDQEKDQYQSQGKDLCLCLDQCQIQEGDIKNKLK